jgi:hypothetical protein
MKYKLLIIFFFILAVFYFSCVGRAENSSRTSVVYERIDYVVPAKSRSFYMGFTPWPYDFTPKGKEAAYNIIDKHADMIAHYIDTGIPWPEALEKKPFHPNVLKNIDDRVKPGRALKKGQKVYLALTPLSPDRQKMARYWAKKGNQPLPRKWKNKKFDDPLVAEAYLNYCRFMIKRFNPDYLCYAIEANMAWESENEPAFLKFMLFLERVYHTLKKENPSLPLFVSFSKNKKTAGIAHNEINKKLLTVSDLVAVSTYPFIGQTGNKANPSYLRIDFFNTMAALSSEKPFAVVETGYPAETITIKKFLAKMEKKGSDRWQADYVRFLLEESNRLNAKLVVWFFSRDFDAGWEKMKKAGLPAIARAFRDTGLIDGKGRSRPAMTVWDAWLKLPIKTK